MFGITQKYIIKFEEHTCKFHIIVQEFIPHTHRCGKTTSVEVVQTGDQKYGSVNLLAIFLS